MGKRKRTEKGWSETGKSVVERRWIRRSSGATPERRCG